MPNLRRLLGLLLFLLLAGGASAQFGDNKVLVTPSLVADTSIVAAGKPFTVGILLKLAPHWHTYWEFSGDAGAAPSVEWQLPPGFQAGPIQWPMPHSRMDEGDLLSYVYEDEVLLPVQITPPAALPAGEITLKANLRWLVCEKTCIPGKGAVQITLHGGDAPAPANGDLFAKWRAQLPKAGAPFPVKWELSDPKALRVSMPGFPAEVKVEFFPLPPEGVTADHPAMAPPAADGTRTVTVPLTGTPAAGATWRGLIVAQNGDKPREGWLVSASDPAAPAVAASTAPSGASAAPSAPASPGGPAALGPVQTLPSVLLLAFLGGLLLNVMPCVLPVIALKIFGFVHQGGKDPTRVSRLGLAFVAGVFVFFLGLATAVAILGRAFHWGFQFQNPYVLAGLIALVFVFGLNLLGVFEITLSSGATSTLSDLSSKEGYRGAFLHGLFTTLLGTSCTAPMLAPALGFATTQSAPVIFLLFTAMATGLSLPYFLLTSNPGWLKYLPKPGVWMERFKQAMGFIMLALAVWLFTVFAGRGVEATASLAWFLLVLALGCWLFGVITRRGVGALVAVLLALWGYFALLHGRLDAQPRGAAAGAGVVKAAGIDWQPFSEQAVNAALQEKKPLFIDFTADWCLNCKFFERTVLASDAVASALRDHKVTTLRADWTQQDPAITKWLNQFGRVGVPLYVLYRPGEKDPVVQDGLTRQGMLQELGRIPK